jgi:Tol biopolymer transport system component
LTHGRAEPRRPPDRPARWYVPPDVRRSLAPFALVLALASCGGGGKPVDEIAFRMNVGGFGEIWVTRPDGSHRQRLTEAAPPKTDAVGASVPAWSPDGKRLAYAFGASDHGRSAVYVMNADGSDQHSVVSDGGVNTQPGWSPDGKRIAFARFGAQRGIAVIPADGGTATQVTHSGGAVYDAAPAWSPDGKSIAFTRILVTTDVEHQQEAIYLTGANGTGLKKLIDGGGASAWSPDGTRIAYTSIRDHNGRTCFQDCTPSGEIYVANADGSHQRRLTRSTADDRSATWSPDGRSIAFASDRSDPQRHEYEIYVMRADGSGLHRVTTGGASNTDPAWRP